MVVLILGYALLNNTSVISSKFINKFVQKCQCYYTLPDQLFPYSFENSSTTPFFLKMRTGGKNEVKKIKKIACIQSCFVSKETTDVTATRGMLWSDKV